MSSEPKLTQSQKTFSENEVLKLIEEIKVEAEKSIENAYNEGFKAATVYYSPIVFNLENKVATQSVELKSFKKQRILIPILSITGAVVGFGCGLLSERFVQ